MWPTVLNMWRGRGVKEWREKAGDRVGRRRDCVRVCGVLGGQQARIGGAPSRKGSPQCWRSLTYPISPGGQAPPRLRLSPLSWPGWSPPDGHRVPAALSEQRQGGRQGGVRGPLTTFKQVVQIVKWGKQGHPVTLLELELLPVGRALMPG